MSKSILIFGVSGWVASKFDVSVDIIRILFIVFTFAGGAGVLLYLVLFLLKYISEK